MTSPKVSLEDKDFDVSKIPTQLLSDTGEYLQEDQEKIDKGNYTFYYDESDNQRKIAVTPKGTNASLDADFVLGGILIPPGADIVNWDAFLKKIGIKQHINELKFDKLRRGRGGTNFSTCLSRRRVKRFLEWLLDGNFYIHYLVMDPLYFIIVDIVDRLDSIASYFNQAELLPYKNELYQCAKNHLPLFITILQKYDFAESIQTFDENFYLAIIDMIQKEFNSVQNQITRIKNYRKCTLVIKRKILLGGLISYLNILVVQRKKLHDENNAVIPDVGSEKILLSGYSEFYLRTLVLFPHLQHIFDDEPVITSRFNNLVIHNGTENINYAFVDSQDSIWIQVSDCVAGLLRSYYNFVNQYDMLHVDDAWDDLMRDNSKEVGETFKLFAKVLMKSESFSKLLLCNVISLNEHDVSSTLLKRVL